MAHELTPCQENYLEHIHRLSGTGRPIRIRDIADAAGVRMPSVTRAVRRLADAGLVVHQRYGTVEITRQGIVAAEAVHRRDRCLQTLLIDVLAMDERTARAEVCRLEHVLSSEVLERLEVLLDHALRDSSRTWLGGLHRKLRRRDAGATKKPRAQIGTSSLHVRHE